MENREYESIWTACLAKLQDSINDMSAFSNFFYDTSIISINNDLVTIGASNSFAAQVLNRKYVEQIQKVVEEITQTNYKILIIDKGQASSDFQPIVEREKVFISNLNPKFTFDNFVVGVSNREAYMAAYATAMDPGKFYNPLFIYGKSGLGKTHLAHAIGNYIRSKNDNVKVLYKSVDDFVEDVVKAFKDQGIEVLKDFYRDVDVFLLDDIQFLTTKEKSKEVLFSIFNNLINAGKQIILTSDKPISELKHLEDRLVGRFSQGLSVQIKDLEYETAYQILCKKIEALDINQGRIEEDVIKYIATNYSKDVRQLEGALNKILFYAITLNPSSSIDMNLIKNTFAVINKKPGEGNLTIEKIKIAVSEYYSISISQLEGKQRTSNIAIARHIAMWLCRTMLDVSLNQIGEGFGGKDHTTVINAIEKVDNLLKEDISYKQAVDELKKLLKNQ